MTTIGEFLEFKKDKAFMEKLMRECDEEMEQEFEDQLERLKETRKQKAPVLFVGSGISRRYLDSPDWEGLLKAALCKGWKKRHCKKKYFIKKSFGKKHFKIKCCKEKYDELREAANGDFEKIAQEIEFYCFRGCTDQELKAAGSRRAVLRRRIADVIKPAGGTLEAKLKNSDYRDEIGALKRIRPAAIITTNYDTLLEELFSGYKPIIGQTDIFRQEPSGQKYIYKIHGSVTNAESILITKEDYDTFFEKSKYLYAKILTTFLEYPLIFMGYSIRDRNILHILTAIREMLTEEEAKTFAQRIWILDWQKYTKTGHVEECKIELLNGQSINVTKFVMGDFTRFFEAMGGHDEPLKLLVSEDVVALLIGPLYNGQNKLQVAVRELLQNALDACKLANWEAAKITVRYEEEGEDAFLSVEDNGIGMDETDIREKYLTVGKSGKEGQDNLTGKYGIGALSMFLIGKSAEVLTKQENGEALAFRLSLQGDRGQAQWSDWEEERPAAGSYTVVRIELEQPVTAQNCASFLHQIGLDTYVVSGSQEITVSFKGEEARIRSIAKVLDCFEPIPIAGESERQFVKLLDVGKMAETLHTIIPDDEKLKKLFKYDYNVQDLKKRYLKKKSDEDELKKLLRQKNTILYNDMVSRISYDKDKYKMLKYISIPFLWAAGKVEPDWLETELSRGAVRIGPKLMELIAVEIYDRELAAIGAQLEQLKADPKNSDIKAVVVALKLCPAFFNCDFVLCGNRIFLGGHETSLPSYWLERGARAEIKQEGNYQFNEGVLDKKPLSIELACGNVAYLSVKYLEKYLLRATGPASGLRRDAVDILFARLGLDDFDDCDSAAELWQKIGAEKGTIQERISKKSKNGLLPLWPQEDTKQDFQEDYTDAYFVKLNRESVREMDPLFIKRMKLRLNDETEQGDIWRHYFTLA